MTLGTTNSLKMAQSVGENLESTARWSEDVEGICLVRHNSQGLSVETREDPSTCRALDDLITSPFS